MSATVSSEGKDYQMEANETKAKQTPQLKQLPIEFVRSASCKAIETATGLASTYTPTPVAEAAMAVYERWAPTVKPYANAAIEAVYPKAETALVTVDTKVGFFLEATREGNAEGLAPGTWKDVMPLFLCRACKMSAFTYVSPVIQHCSACRELDNHCCRVRWTTL